MLTKMVCVWYDDTGTPDDPRWVVSVDNVDLASNETANTTTIEALPSGSDRSRALAAGRRIAAEKRLPLYEYEPNTNGYARGNRHTLVCS